MSIFRGTRRRAAAPSASVRERPALLRALGRAEPPAAIEVDARRLCHATTFKHDSWAATALYVADDGERIVCKFNRIQPVFGIPMRWLGRWLANRERRMLHALADEPLVPAACDDVLVSGRRAPHCVAHAFVPGRPLVRHMPLDATFFPMLETLLQRVHRRGIAYVDLHKRENILVGEDGRPYLIDFQISLQLPARGPVGAVLRLLQRCDAYHLAKHIRRGKLDQGIRSASPRSTGRPWIIRLHRRIAVPMRTSRRALLVWLGVRTKGGRAQSEVAPEVGALQWTGR
jgi:hypothetical protein